MAGLVPGKICLSAILALLDCNVSGNLDVGFTSVTNLPITSSSLSFKKNLKMLHSYK